MKQHTAIINDVGVIIRFSHLLFETAFINTFNVEYTPSIQRTIAVNKALLKIVIIPALSNTIIIAKTNIPTAIKLTILKFSINLIYKVLLFCNLVFYRKKII